MCPKSVYFVYMSLVTLVWVHPFHPFHPPVFQSLEMFFFLLMILMRAFFAPFSFETRSCSTSQGWLIDGPFRDSKCSSSRTTWCRLKRSIRRSCRQSLRRAVQSAGIVHQLGNKVDQASKGLDSTMPTAATMEVICTSRSRYDPGI